MRYDNDRLLITLPEWEAAGLTYTMYETARKRKQLEATRACNGRPVEIYFDSLPDDKQALLNHHYNGNIYSYQRNERMTELLKLPAIVAIQASAHKFYSGYKSTNNKFLPRQPKDYVQLLTQAAGWLELFNMMCERTLPVSKEELKAWRAGNYAALRLMLEAKKVELPYSYAKLTIKRNAFIKDGHRHFEALIPKTLENQNSRKIKRQEQLVVLKQLHGRQQNLYLPKTTFDFNVVALQQGWTAGTDEAGNPKPLRITPETAANYLKAFEWQLKAQREGMHSWRNNFDLVIKRERPSAPLYMTNHDGWDYERFYQKVTINSNGHRQRTYHHRKTVIFVTDAFNDYILGYCIADGESKEAIKLALKSAVDHIKEITGSYALPWQIKCDNFGLPVGNKTNDLKQFYEAIAYHPEWVSTSEVGNARDKVIENWFDKFNTKHIQEHVETSYNWSGRNLGAENQANRDWVEMVQKTFPDEQGVIEQIHDDIARARATNQAQWLEAFNALPESDKRIISREQYLSIFGTQTAKPKQLTNQGLNPTIGGIEYWYLNLTPEFFKYIGEPFRIIYDDTDRTSILAINDEHRVSFLVQLEQRQKMAFMDMRGGQRARLNELLVYKKQLKETVAETNSLEMQMVMGTLDAESIQKMFPAGSNKHLLRASSDALKGGPTNESNYLDLL